MAGLVVATFEHLSGTPEDRVVNTIAISGTPTDLSTNATAILNAVEDFYDVTPTGETFPIRQRIGPTISRVAGVHTLQLYDITDFLDGSPHGSPIATQAMTIGANDATGGLPSECAAVLRLHALGRGEAPVETADGVDADSLVDRPKQRHTGRLYIGPLTKSAANVGVSSRPVVDDDFAAVCTSALKDLDAALRAIALASLAVAVWSRQDQAIRTLEAVSMDNAFDTMRSRGEAPTSNTLLAIP